MEALYLRIVNNEIKMKVRPRPPHSLMHVLKGRPCASCQGAATLAPSPARNHGRRLQPSASAIISSTMAATAQILRVEAPP